MPAVEVRNTPRNAGDELLNEELLIEDWLGFASYLAEAVGGGDLTVDAARAELAAGASGNVERETLRRAAGVAAARLGADSLITALLQPADAHDAVTAEVA
jgi:hypothetical protein